MQQQQCNKYICEKYMCNNETEINESLENYGVAIVPNILNDQECENLYQGMFDSLAHITKDTENPIIKEDPTTWKHFKKLFPSHSMLIQHWKMGHIQSVWDIRQNPKIVDVFSKIYQQPQENMLVSFDGVSFQFPPEIVNFGWLRKSWFHSDQSFTRPNKECIQGWVTAKDVNVGDATLSFFEGSHKFHKQFAETFSMTDKKDWCILKTKEQHTFYESKCEEKRISCPKGSLVLWDSRTIHCGTEPFQKRENPNFRCVVYVCYQPRSLSTETQLAKKRMAFNNLRMTNHYPCKIKLFGKNPNTYGPGRLPINISDIPPPVLTDLGKKLAGF